MFIRLSLCVALIASLCSGCGSDNDDNDAEPEPGTVTGSVVGKAVPPQAKAVVVWSVSSGSPDYAYKFGEGSSKGKAFTVSLSTDPPAEAINRYGVGIGIVVLVPSDAAVPEGKITSDDVQLLGITPRHAIIWRADSAGDTPHWGPAFPKGYSCGRCVDAAEGDSFDSFEPISCDELELDTSNLEDPDVCNWT